GRRAGADLNCPSGSLFAAILRGRVDKVDAMDKVDWVTSGACRTRATLNEILFRLLDPPRCVSCRDIFRRPLGTCAFSFPVSTAHIFEQDEEVHGIGRGGNEIKMLVEAPGLFVF